jgi:tetratricopeptide (TPR) repeat protein
MSHVAWLGRSIAVAALLSLGPAAAAASDGEAEARVHFQKGMAAFELGKFQEALAEYERAYELAPLPGFLFNIGQCHRQMKDYQKAVFFLEGYLREKPKARNREMVLKLIEDSKGKLAAEAKSRQEQERRMQEQARQDEARRLKELELKRLEGERALATAKALAAEKSRPLISSPLVPTKPPPPEEPPSIYRRWWFWALVGVVVVGATAGGVVLGTSSGGEVLPGGSLGTVDWR